MNSCGASFSSKSFAEMSDWKGKTRRPESFQMLINLSFEPVERVRPSGLGWQIKVLEKWTLWLVLLNTKQVWIIFTFGDFVHLFCCSTHVFMISNHFIHPLNNRANQSVLFQGLFSLARYSYFPPFGGWLKDLPKSYPKYSHHCNIKTISTIILCYK